MKSTRQQTDLPSRRTFLRSATGLGGIALQSIFTKENASGATSGNTPPDGQPHFTPRAKNVIWLFMRGGVSHMESFDPKPDLTKYAGKSISETPFAEVQSPEKLKKVRVVVVNDAGWL